MRVTSATPDTDGALARAWAQAQRAGRTAEVQIIEAHTADECRHVRDLLNSIWGATELDILDLSFMIALVHSGNPVLLAIHQGEPVGAAVGFSGPPATPFHSHIVGVVPQAAGRGVGRALKLYQRAWCIARGIDRMAWTFDPLVARNAYFNLRRLGGVPVEYHPDFYGVMSDAVNAGQQSDRMVIEWDLAQEPPDRARDAEPDVLNSVVVVDNTGDRPGPLQLPSPGTGVGVAALVGVPRDIEAIRATDPDLAQQWRSVTREAFVEMFASGWMVRSFARTGHYVLTHEETP